MRDSAVVMSSTRPSTKYSCSTSPLMFWNGSTAMEGLSGRARTGAAPLADSGSDAEVWFGHASGSHPTLKVRTGRSIFFQRKAA